MTIVALLPVFFRGNANRFDENAHFCEKWPLVLLLPARWHQGLGLISVFIFA